MRKFVINVNGNSYEVEVEEILQDGAKAAAPVQPVSAPAAAPSAPAAKPAAPKPAAAPAQKSSSAPEGATKVMAPMPGTIIKIVVNTGDSVKKGQVLLILEAMKMENEIVAPSDGKIASINVSSGDSVNAGDLLVSIL